MEHPFVIGQTYSRRQDIHQVYGGQQQGGISTPADAPFVFIFTGEAGDGYGYTDKFLDDGSFLYTGEGQVGDMEFVRGNRAIRDHADDGKMILLFQALGHGQPVRFKGEFRSTGWRWIQTPDRDDEARRAIQFHLTPVSNNAQASRPIDSSVDAENVWSQGYSVLLTSFSGFTPDTWGTVSFTEEGRRNSLTRQLSDPFIAVIYIPANRQSSETAPPGNVVGFYLVNHEQGHRDQFTHPIHHELSPSSWQYGLRATRAFQFVPEFQLSVDEFDPTINDNRRYRSIAKSGEVLGQASIEKLSNIPFTEVAIYRGHSRPTGEIIAPWNSAGRVRGGPGRHTGYYVEAEPVDMPKELYILRLTGDPSSFLGAAADGRVIYKIGMSMSPALRLKSLNDHLPNGAYTWETLRSTRDHHSAFSGHDEALEAENRMKDFLETRSDWLGGEFYAARPDVMEEAWLHGHLSP